MYPYRIVVVEMKAHCKSFAVMSLMAGGLLHIACISLDRKNCMTK